MLSQSLNKQDRIKELKQLYIAYNQDRSLVNQEWQEFFDETQFQALDLKSKTININTNNFKEIHIKKILHLLSNNLT